MTNSERVKLYNRTKDGLVTKIFSSQNNNSKRRGHKPPTYTKQELKDWLFSQPLFHKLYDNWKRLDYQKEYKPSVDRKNDFVGYTIDNIQLMTWGENKKKQNKDIFNNKSTSGKAKCKRVKQYSIDGKFITEYHSISKAERETEIANNSIVLACKGKRETAGGFKWKYA